MKIAITIAIAVLLSAVVAVAEHQITLGEFSCEGGYNAPSLCLSDCEGTKWSAYWEHDGHLNADLGIARVQVADGIMAVGRYDRPNLLRAGAEFGIGGGKTKTTVRSLVGLGHTPNMTDVWLPTMPISKHFSIDGWARFRQGKNTMLWVGPSVCTGGCYFAYRFNLNNGPWAAWASLPPWQF